MTGTYIAPLGLQKGLIAIVIGHIIGCSLLFLVGLIGAKQGVSSMETAKNSFGKKGGKFFAILNIFQLVGWTSIMIYDGALAAEGIFKINHSVWCLTIGALIILWILIGITSLGKVKIVVIAALFILTIVLSITIFGGNNSLEQTFGQNISFSVALELSIAMPISYLPLISDYTSIAKQPVKASFVSAATYGVVSSWMYIIGMGAAIFIGTNDVALILIQAGLGFAGLLIIVFSTVTSTFVDAWSAGVSTQSIFVKVKGKYVSFVVALIAVLCAVIFPMDNISNFLYFIGSVFAPMIAIQIADFFLLKLDLSKKDFELSNLIIWVMGFAIYRYLMTLDIFIGYTILDMIIVVVLCLVVGKIKQKVQKKHRIYS